MTKDTTDLFNPLVLGPNTLRNRIVMAPMTRNRAGTGNVPHAMNAEYYRQRAGAGLIIAEASQVSPEGVGYPATPGIHSPQQVAGWKQITQVVHSAGGLIYIQLWYCGRISHPDLLPDHQQPVSASAITPQGEASTLEGMKPFVEPRALDMDELPGIVEQYRKAAENARAAGFDGLEIHAANGYLLDQFLRDGSNQRDDDYGGSIANRSRLLMEIVGAVSQVWDMSQIGVRISPENSFNDMRDSDPQTTFDYLAKHLGNKGIGYLHVFEGDMMGAEPKVEYRQIKQNFGGIYMANSGYDYNRARNALRRGEADLVSFGVPYLANPDLAERFRTGTRLNVPDQATFYGGDAHGYTDYPFIIGTQE